MVGMTNQRYYTVPNKMVKRGVDVAHADLLTVQPLLQMLWIITRNQPLILSLNGWESGHLENYSLFNL